MKSSKNATSRRHFLKTTSRVAAGSALAGAAAPQAHSAVPTLGPREAYTEKLGKIVPKPPGAFAAIPIRLPGWRADTQSNGTVKLFLEEGLHSSAGLYDHFPPPRNSQGQSFVEPDPTDPASAWNDFNKWMLGSTLPNNPVSDFDIFLAQLATLVRRYNAALYWMRRLHFWENAPPGSTQLPPNPSGDPPPYNDLKTPLPGPKSGAFQPLVNDAIKAWQGAIKALNGLLDSQAGYRLTNTMADMVEVNGYIVSMRVVSDPITAKPVVPEPGHQQMLEIPGSSSSHISISSAFSSS